MERNEYYRRKYLKYKRRYGENKSRYGGAQRGPRVEEPALYAGELTRKQVEEMIRDQKQLQQKQQKQSAFPQGPSSGLLSRSDELLQRALAVEREEPRRALLAAAPPAPPLIKPEQVPNTREYDANGLFDIYDYPFISPSGIHTQRMLAEVTKFLIEEHPGPGNQGNCNTICMTKNRSMTTRPCTTNLTTAGPADCTTWRESYVEKRQRLQRLIEQVQHSYMPSDSPIFNRAINIDIGGKPYTVVNIHSTSAAPEQAVVSNSELLNDLCGQFPEHNFILGGDFNMYYKSTETELIDRFMGTTLTNCKGTVGEHFNVWICTYAVRKDRPSNFFENAQAAYKSAEEPSVEETMVLCIPKGLEFVPIYPDEHGAGRVEGDFMVRVNDNLVWKDRMTKYTMEDPLSYGQAYSAVLVDADSSGESPTVKPFAEGRGPLQLYSDHLPIGGTFGGTTNIVFANNMSIRSPTRGYVSADRSQSNFRPTVTPADVQRASEEVKEIIVRHFNEIAGRLGLTIDPRSEADLVYLSVGMFKDNPLIPDKWGTVEENVKAMYHEIFDRLMGLLKEGKNWEREGKDRKEIINKSLSKAKGKLASKGNANLKYVTNALFSQLVYQSVCGFTVPDGKKINPRLAHDGKTSVDVWHELMLSQLFHLFPPDQGEEDGEATKQFPIYILCSEDYSATRSDDTSIGEGGKTTNPHEFTAYLHKPSE